MLTDMRHVFSIYHNGKQKAAEKIIFILQKNSTASPLALANRGVFKMV